MGQGQRNAQQEAEFQKRLAFIAQQLGLDPSIVADLAKQQAAEVKAGRQDTLEGRHTIGLPRPNTGQMRTHVRAGIPSFSASETLPQRWARNLTPAFIDTPLRSPRDPDVEYGILGQVKGPATGQTNYERFMRAMAGGKPEPRSFPVGTTNYFDLPAVRNFFPALRREDWFEKHPQFRPKPDREAEPIETQQWWELSSDRGPLNPATNRFEPSTRQREARPNDPIWGTEGLANEPLEARQARAQQPGVYEPDDMRSIIGLIHTAARQSGITPGVGNPIGAAPWPTFAEQHGGKAMGQGPSFGTGPIPQTPENPFETALQRVERRMAEAGYPIRRTSELRTPAQQREQYNKGRSTPGRIVTNADGTVKKSLHQSGSAADLAFANTEHQGSDQAWNLLGQIAEEEGLEWGGRWKPGPGRVGPERWHVQMPGTTAAAPQARRPDPMEAMPSHTPAPGADPYFGFKPGSVPLGMTGPRQPGNRYVADLIPEKIRTWLEQQRDAQSGRPSSLPQIAAQNMRPPGPQLFDPDVQEVQPQPPLMGGFAMPTMPGAAPRTAPLDEPMSPDGGPAFGEEGVPINRLEVGDASFGMSDEEGMRPRFGVGQTRFDEEGAEDTTAPTPPYPQQRQQVAGEWRLQPKPMPKLPAEPEEPDEPPAAAMPTWKIALTNIINSLPDAIIGFTSAWADKPEIADNWLKARALKIEDANERAKIAATYAKDNFDRQMKLLDWEQKQAEGRRNSAKAMSDLHSRMAEGKLLDLNSYFAELNLYANEYRSFGGNYQDLVAAYPVPFMDKIGTLRGQFDQMWKNAKGDESELNAARFRHPLTEQPITGWDAMKILGMFDAQTGQPILSLPDLTKLEHTRIDPQGREQDVIEFKTPHELRSGSFKPIPQSTTVSQPTPSGGLIATTLRDGKPVGPPVIIPGASKNESLAATMQGMDLTGQQKIRRDAGLAVMRMQSNNPLLSPTPEAIDEFLNSTDAETQSDILEMETAMRQAIDRGRPKPGKSNPWGWLTGTDYRKNLPQFPNEPPR